MSTYYIWSLSLHLWSFMKSVLAKFKGWFCGNSRNSHALMRRKNKCYFGFLYIVKYFKQKQQLLICIPLFHSMSFILQISVPAATSVVNTMPNVCAMHFKKTSKTIGKAIVQKQQYYYNAITFRKHFCVIPAHTSIVGICFKRYVNQAIFLDHIQTADFENIS